MKLNIITTALFILMTCLFLLGVALVLGVMEDFKLPQFVIAKLTGLTAIYLGYYIFKKNFKKYEILD